jgi:hypothetical protein
VFHHASACSNHGATGSRLFCNTNSLRKQTTNQSKQRARSVTFCLRLCNMQEKKKLIKKVP